MASLSNGTSDEPSTSPGRPLKLIQPVLGSSGQIGWGGSVMAFLTLALVVVGFAAAAWMYYTRYDSERDARRQRLHTPVTSSKIRSSTSRRGKADELLHDDI
jgi:hypothetical protein